MDQYLHFVTYFKVTWCKNDMWPIIFNVFIAFLYLLACFTVSGLLIYYIWVIRYKEEIEEIRKTEENPLIGQNVEARDSTVAYWLNKLNNNK